MERYRNWRDTAPLGAIYAIAAVVWIGFQLLFHMQDFGRGDTGTVVIITVIGGLVFAGLLTGIVAWQRRRNGGTSTFAAINRAIRSGEAPEDAEPSVWMPALERRRRQLRRVRWIGPIEFGLFAALGVVLLVTGWSLVLGVAVTVFFLAMAVYYPFMAQRQLAKIVHVEAQLSPTPAR